MSQDYVVLCKNCTCNSRSLSAIMNNMRF